VIEMSCPVMKCEASLTKKTRTGAKSRAGSPNCPPSGSRAAMLSSNRAISSGVNRCRCSSYMGVLMAGRTVFAVIRYLPHSEAILRVYAMTPPFDAA